MVHLVGATAFRSMQPLGEVRGIDRTNHLCNRVEGRMITPATHPCTVRQRGGMTNHEIYRTTLRLFVRVAVKSTRGLQPTYVLPRPSAHIAPAVTRARFKDHTCEIHTSLPNTWTWPSFLARIQSPSRWMQNSNCYPLT